MYLGKAADIIIKLPVAGVTYNNVTASYLKQGGVLTPYILTALQWVEMPNNNYIVKLPASLIDTIGFFHMYFAGNFTLPDTTVVLGEFTFSDHVYYPPLGASYLPDVCIVAGNVVNLGAKASQIPVVFRTVYMPKRVGLSLVSAERVLVYPDAVGNFSALLIRGTTVWVEIPQAGINYQITIPNQPTALLLDLLPSIP